MHREGMRDACSPSIREKRTMLQYIIRRLLQGVLIIFLVTTATFVVVRLMPGDPVFLLLGEGQVQITNEQIAAIRSKWGLDDPIHVQYITWIGNMAQGNFGESIIRTGVPISQMIGEAAPLTAMLNLLALGVAILVAIPTGMIAGAKRNSAFDYGASFFATLGVALPNFWLSLMLVILFALVLRLLPPFGIRSWQGWILPVFVLATEQMAILTRITRSAMIEALGQDYTRTARAKGLGEQMVLFRHALRNALLPVVSVIGYQFAFLLSGTIVTETIFAIPGIGRLLIDSVFRLDYQVVQAIVLLLAVLVVSVNLIVDLIYGLVDPRIRLS
jgi:peptide/nickel transport system permease protein